MKISRILIVAVLVLCLVVPSLAQGGGGYGGGRGGPPGGGGANGGGEDDGGGGVDDGGGGEIPADIPDTGELYGDLYVILRDENGVPMLDGNGCIQPIAVTDSVEPITVTYCWDETNEVLTQCAEGEDPDIEIDVTDGEPLTLAYLEILVEGEAVPVVECELTEEMTAWVQSVDFGRLNLGRAPESVIEHAFDEAVNKMNVAQEITLDPAGRLLLTLPDTETEDPDDTVVKAIDAPAENLALYIKMMIDGHWLIPEGTLPIVMGGPPDGVGPPEGDGPSTEPRPVLNESAISLLNTLGFTSLGVDDGNNSLTDEELVLAASLLAAAADKTGSITLDKVVYINSIYGINQVGGLPGEVEGKSYYDFSGYGYDRGLYGGRKSGDCLDGWIWVLQPDLDDSGNVILNHFETQCMEILGYENSDHDPAINTVRFTDMEEAYTTVMDAGGNPLAYDFDDNVRAFAKAADDALQVIEYIHNYKVPEDLYGTWSE